MPVTHNRKYNIIAGQIIVDHPYGAGKAAMQNPTHTRNSKK